MTIKKLHASLGSMHYQRTKKENRTGTLRHQLFFRPWPLTTLPELSGIHVTSLETVPCATEINPLTKIWPLPTALSFSFLIIPWNGETIVLLKIRIASF